MLDTSTWKEFSVGGENGIFLLEKTRGKVTDELLDGNDIAYIAAKKTFNGFSQRCQLEGFEDWVSKGNCIVFVCIGAGSAGYATYQPEDFIGMNGKTICGYNENLNENIGIFLETVLSCERPKYSFGRSWTGERLANTKIKLPVTKSNEPDWVWMDTFISKQREQLRKKFKLEL